MMDRNFSNRGHKNSKELTNQIGHMKNCPEEKYRVVMASYQQKIQRYFFHSGLWRSRVWVILNCFSSMTCCVTGKACDTVLWMAKNVELLGDRNRLSQRCLALKVQDHWNLAKDIKINCLLSLSSGIQTNFSNKNKIVVRVCHSKLSVNQLKAFFPLMDATCIFCKWTCLYSNGTFICFCALSSNENLCLFHFFFLRWLSFRGIYSDTDINMHYCNWLWLIHNCTFLTGMTTTGASVFKIWRKNFYMWFRFHSWKMHLD